LVEAQRTHRDGRTLRTEGHRLKGGINVANQETVMSTLTYAPSDRAAVVAPDTRPARKPFLRRLFERIVEAQQRRADREIAHYLATHGHLLNDAAEREIMRRLAGGRRLV
jgi:hypothetical protein